MPWSPAWRSRNGAFSSGWRSSGSSESPPASSGGETDRLEDPGGPAEGKALLHVPPRLPRDPPAELRVPQQADEGGRQILGGVRPQIVPARLQGEALDADRGRHH